MSPINEKKVEETNNNSMSEINTINSQNKDGNVISGEVKEGDYGLKPQGFLASIFLRKNNSIEGLYLNQYSWEKDGEKVTYINYILNNSF